MLSIVDEVADGVDVVPVVSVSNGSEIEVCFVDEEDNDINSGDDWLNGDIDWVVVDVTCSVVSSTTFVDIVTWFVEDIS